MKTYKHGVDEPRFEKIGSGKGGSYDMKDCADFKAQASDQAYGQQGERGCHADNKKIRSQFFHAYTDDAGY